MSLDAPLNGAADWTPAGPLTPITPEERERLAGLEQVIETGLVSFVAVGTALAEVRDDRLYRGTHSSFEAYVQDKWHFSGRRAYQLMEAAEVCTTVQAQGAPPLANEAQARAIGLVPPEDRAEVLNEVAAAGKVTAKAIEEHPKHPKPAAPPAQQDSGAAPSPPPAAPPPADPAPAPPPASAAVEAGREHAAPPRPGCSTCGATEVPLPGGRCADCWAEDVVKAKVTRDHGSPPPKPEPQPAPAAAPKPPKLGDLGTEQVDRCWKPFHQIRKALAGFPPPDEITATLPPDSVESFDQADDLIEWAEAWKQARKANPGLRLVEGR